MVKKEIAIVELTNENRPEVLKFALSMYLGERCKYCGVTFTTIDDLKTTVYAGYHQWGRLAHKKCWDKKGDSNNG